MNAQKSLRALRVLALIAILLLLPAGAASSQGVAGSDSIPEVQPAVDPQFEVLNLHLDIPTGARIDYLRIFYYDSSPSDSIAWVTTYDGAGGLSDLTSVASSGAAGYGTNLSGFVNHIVNNLDNAYVLNWRPYQLGSSMRLCGLRVAYRLPTGPSTWSEFYYVFAAGSTLLPRSSGVGWSNSPDGGCTFVDYRNFLPIVRKG
jgi:hypothetical protein